ncbi:arrestin domain-containing protein 3-like [Centropristis striata]|uniref:arrestin domain-containing protein 3-like n=1 Tax=Centropristis striata TaxID=184440 RepID=UPI0027DF037B|nr:arrestin domain-containing protein 3-like [Centropristis striata]
MFQQTIKNFNINFNALGERNTVSSGDLLTGHLSFDITKETKITSITMELKGGVNVQWSSGSSKNRRHFSAKIEYFKLKSVILQENNAVGEGTRLQPGTHMYPFTCQFPRGDFPSSFIGANGRINYSLTVSIHRSWRMAKDFAVELKYVNRIDTNQPELHAPLSGINGKTLCCLWCTSGPISMKVSTEKKAFMPGETVKIICEFSNGSSRTATPTVSLQQKQVCYTHNRVSQRWYIKKLVSVFGQPISGETSGVHTGIVITIPSATPLTISNCSIIDVSYLIEVTLRVKYASDLTVLIPIILCDTPVDPQPPAYM